MAYNEKPQLHLYEYKNNTFSQIAIIDDYSEISFERNLYQAGQFTITINHNLPNASKFEKGLFIQFGSDPYDFGEIRSISDSIGSDGKGSQNRIISGFDCRYLYKRRIIKNLNNNDTWQMTDKGEICLRSLIYSEAGEGAEAKRRLPITNIIPTSQNAIGKEYSVSEAFTNLYDVLCTIATQSEIGWRVKFENNSLSLECYLGEDKHTTVQFSTDFETLSNGTFTDTNENFSNAVYVGGKGDGSERDIYEGESAINDSSPSGFDRFECWDNQSEMNTEDEYSKEALSMLTQYGQTLTVNGNGLAKSIYVYKEQYNVGDIISISFSGRKANVQILSVTEHWTGRGNYGITFSFGKPVNNLADQIKLLLNKIQIASSKANTIDSVKWYEFSNANLSQDKKDVTFNSIGFTGTLTANRSFTFYLDDEGTGSKTYNIYAKNLSGNYNITLTTGKSGATDYILPSGNYVAQVYIDEEGNILERAMSTVSEVTSGNPQPVNSDAVIDALTDKGLVATKTDNAIARWDGTTGKLQNSGVTINDSNVISGGSLNNVANVGMALSNGVTCSTAAATAAKTVALTGFVLRKGAKLLVNVSNANTSATALTLNVNGTGAKTIRANGTVTNTSYYTLAAGWYNCYYDGTYWNMDSSYEAYNARNANYATQADYTRGTAYCNSSAETVGKLASMRGYVLRAGACFPITFTNSNSANSMTLNVNGTGAKPVYLNGQAVSSSNKTLNSGTYLCFYDGNVYHIGFSGASTTATYGGLLTASKWSWGTTSGYIKFSNGLIIQWGINTSSRSYGREITMPIAFSDTNYTVVCVRYATADYDDTSCTVYRSTAQKFHFYTDSAFASYIAIGY